MRPSSPKVAGVSRVGDNEKVIAVDFDRRPTDNEMRAFHDYLRGFK
jgi:hypothetical protein